MIGIYYVANSVISGLLQCVLIFGTEPLEKWFANLPPNMIEPVLTLIVLVVLLAFALGCALIYWFVYWMLDRKLNLA